MKPQHKTLRVLLLSCAGLACLFSSMLMRAQTTEEVEKAIANLPTDQRAYERFRFWMTSLPPDQQWDAKVEARYREYLKSRGFSDAEADAQIKLVDQRGTRAEVERWNRILTSEKPAFNTKPNAFLMEIAKTRKPGKALDIGMGQGATVSGSRSKDGT